MCPEDSQSISELLLYSEFAMTEAKRFEKGGVGFFSKQKYSVFLDISDSGDKFDELLKKEAISFVYVPYVDSVSGDVSVFEMFPVGHVQGLNDVDSIKTAAKYFHRLIELDRVIYEALKEEFMEDEDSCPPIQSSVLDHVYSFWTSGDVNYLQEGSGQLNQLRKNREELERYMEKHPPEQ